MAAPALSALAVALAIVIRTALGSQPFAGFGAASLIAASALALLAGWTLLSGTWSHAPARALIEFDRALLYLLTLVLFASLPRSAENIRWLVRALALAIAVVGAIALVTRVAPQVWPITPNVRNERLSYPLTYWNSLGLLATIGLVLCVHLTADGKEPRLVRVLAAPAVPILASTLLFTFSRGALAAAVVALVAYVALARPQALLSALIALVPTTLLALNVVYGADLLTGANPTGAAAVEEGEGVALTVGVAAAGAALLRMWLLALDRRASLWPGFLRRHQPWAGRAAAGVLVVALGVAALALGAPSYLDRQYDRFLTGDALTSRSDLRARLTNPTNNGRLEHWRVARDSFRNAELRGAGAGTYQLSWARHRRTSFTVVDGHSLYIEVLGELGIVGLALVAIAILTLLAALALRIRGPDRAVYAGAFAAVLAWALHAGIDWDWEVPAVTLCVFALGGAALAIPQSPRTEQRPGWPVRLAVVVIVLGLCVIPVRAAISQHHLDRSVSALKGGDCQRSIDEALAAESALSVRPEPWEVIGYCDARLGKGRLGVRALENAVERDPQNWEFRYGLALVRGAAGLDPRPAARQALRLNPREELAQEAVQGFRTGGRPNWKRVAREAQLPIPPVRR